MQLPLFDISLMSGSFFRASEEFLFPHLEGALDQHSVHCCHTLQLLPCVFTDFITDIRACNAKAVTGISLTFIAAFAALRNVVIITAGAACMSFGGKRGSSVEKEDTAAGLYVFFNRVHHSCRREQMMKTHG